VFDNLLKLDQMLESVTHFWGLNWYLSQTTVPSILSVPKELSKVI